MPPSKTKLSRVRTSIRFDPPTLEEAIFAAQGLTTDIEGQTQIAAMLMGLPEAEVRAAILKAAAARLHISSRQPTRARVAAGRQPVVVERRTSRVLIR